METTYTSGNNNWLQRFAKQQITQILQKLEHAGLTIYEPENTFLLGNPEAPLQASIKVNNLRFYNRLLTGGSIGAGESWVDGDWHSEDLTTVIRVFARSLPVIDALEKRLAWLRAPFNKLIHRLNRNSRQGSRANIAAHYDLGNDMYQLFLDPYMQYSSAIFQNNRDSLEQAQINKLQVICEKLDLQATDHLVEIGTGWGGLACYAAKHYGCKVTTTTLSKAQYQVAEKRIKDMGLEDKITLLLKDYRDMEGQFDKLVSIEMIEAVGQEYLGSYFASLNNLLKPNGKLLLQAITIADQRYDDYCKNTDFMQRYIFPGGFLPSTSALCEQLKNHTNMTLSRLESFGHHYANTLKKWYQAFRSQHHSLSTLGYGEDFQRLWEFYFCYCEAGFREGTINLIHFEAEKPEARICQSGYGHN